MDNTIVNLLTQIDEIVDHLINVLPASKEQIEQKAFETHPETNCSIGFCKTQDFLLNYNQKLRTFAEKLTKDLTYFENLKCYHNQTNNLNYYNNNNYNSSRIEPDKTTKLKTAETNEQNLTSIKSTINSIDTNQTVETTNPIPKIDIPCTSKQAELKENPKSLVTQNNFDYLDPPNESNLISDSNVAWNENQDQVIEFYEDDFNDENQPEYLFNENQIQDDENSSLINIIELKQTNDEYVQFENINTKSDSIVNTVKESEEKKLNINNEINPDLTVNIVKEIEEKSLNCTNTIYNNNNNNNNNKLDKKSPIEKIKKDELTATGRQSSNSSSAGKMSSGLLSTNLKTGQLLKYIILDPSRRYECWTTHVESPFLVWIQLKNRDALYKELSVKLNRFYNKFEQSEYNVTPNIKKYEILPGKLKIGIYVAAISQVDFKWYRGRIVEIDEQNNLVTIFFIDFGNCEVIPLLSVRLLVEKFLKRYPAFAIPLSIYNACPLKESGWSDSTNEKLCNFLNNRECIFTAYKNARWPIFFGKFTSVSLTDIDNKAKDFDLLSHFVKGLDFGVPLACAKPNDYIVKHFKKLIDPVERYYRLNNYIHADTDEEIISINDLKLNKLSLIDEATNETEIKNLANKPISLVPSTIIEKIQSHGEIVANFKDGLTRSKSELKENITFHCGKKFITNFEQYTRLSDLKQNELVLDEDKSFLFEITEIRNPYKFYVNSCSFDYTQYSKMFNELSEFYTKNQDYFTKLAKDLDYNFVRHNLLCVAKSKVNKNYFYRACLKKIIDIDFEDYENLDESKTKQQKVIVLFIDYGVTEELDITDLLPIAKEFCQKPPCCISCKLYGIEPIEKDNLSQISEDNIWSHDAILYFKSLFKPNIKYKAFLQNVEPNEKINCDYDNPFEILINISETDHVISANDALVECGLASYNFINNTNENKDHYETASQCVRNNDIYSGHLMHKITDFIDIQDDASVENYRIFRTNDWVDSSYQYLSKRIEEKQKTRLENVKIQNKDNNVQVKTKKLDLNNNVIESNKSSETNNDQKIENEFEKWNPIREHYESVRNAYGFNEESMEAHKFGYETKPKPNVCFNFRKNGKCYRDRCPHLHETKDEIIFSSKNKKQQEVYLEATTSLKTFERGDMLLIKIVSFKAPKFIQASILGYYDYSLKTYIMSNNYPEITNKMNKYYGKNKFLTEKTTLFVENQIVAVKEPKSGDWLRGRIFFIHQEEDIEMNKIEVFYIDLGYSDIVSMKDLYRIKKCFLAYPMQCIQLELSNIIIENISDFKSYLNTASNESNYFYAIVNKKRNELEANLEVFLCGLFEKEATSINNELISLGIASPLD